MLGLCIIQGMAGNIGCYMLVQPWRKNGAKRRATGARKEGPPNAGGSAKSNGPRERAVLLDDQVDQVDQVIRRA